MKKFLVLFLAPVSVLEDWMKKSQEERKSAEDKMRDEWNAWMKDNASSIVEAPAGAGKTKSVAKSGVKDIKNDIMMYGVVQANSHNDASMLFVSHPHLGIPEATIEIMEINKIG